MSSRDSESPPLLPPIEAALDLLWLEVADHAANSVRADAETHAVGDNRVFLTQVRRVMSELDMAQGHIDGVRAFFERNSSEKLAKASETPEAQVYT